MNQGNSTVRYTRIARLLHWLLAAALLYQLALGWWMLDVPKSPPGLRAGWFNWHKSIGITIALVVLARLAWRLAHPAPAHAALPAWQQRAATTSHVLLYACMATIPLAGYLGSVFSGYPVRYFGVVLPAWAAAWPAGKQAMSALHYAAVWLFMGLVALHVAAALWHWRRHDGVAQRMGLPA
jgi:cytochrome b561